MNKTNTTKEYPKKEEIKIRWTRTHTFILMTITLIIITFIFYELETRSILLTKWLSVAGLYLDMIGVLIASLKTPYYGAYYDGGELERWREEIEDKYFQFGMYLIALGMLLQTISTLLQ